ncbi:MAG: glycosyltransferase [Campylobacter sputorum]|uniref:glycosyltransferase n=1 Tax=Campylobacter sputorum TaxID=206 RepID=UPI001F1933BA|nr:glycosyltransferase [Campylobacter sputorum]ASM37281.1 glycosyltransferase, family 2 [Campylobacter sputorum bv. faecalis CCUG 20703]ASM38945.1 glycosyltransferase, family 2 [Campylobacter sputorum bv. paraureolyticus LMG 11764]MDY6121188.1 glycosyltransferase [Campylobacter sputorum]
MKNKDGDEINFSVLLSIYYRENPKHFNRAMQSIWDTQILKPNEIVLVEDGELTKELYDEINIWQYKLGDILKIVKLKKNMGLGDALAIGLQECKNELIARMDTDDIALPNRFQRQIEIFKKDTLIDICSSWVGEFEDDENSIYAYRKLPEFHADIVKFAKTRSPLNHVAVMFKKSSVLEAGNYKKMLLIEDYYLWVRMILNGSKFYNIQEVLVNVRAGQAQLYRRQGLKYAINELRVQHMFYKIGFLSIFEFIINSVLKFSVRIMPNFIIKNIYKFLRK